MLDRRVNTGQSARLICEQCELPMITQHEYEINSNPKSDFRIPLEGINFCQCPEPVSRKPNDRLKEIEGRSSALSSQDADDLDWLIARVKRLTAALEGADCACMDAYHNNRCFLKTARKALEDDNGA